MRKSHAKPIEVSLWSHSCADGPILQAIEHILHQTQFGIAEQVRVDVGQEQRGGGNLSTAPGDQVREDALKGRNQVRLDAGNPTGADILTRQGLADEQHASLSHIGE